MTTNTDATIYNLVQTQGGDVRAFRHYIPAVHWYGRPSVRADAAGTAESSAFSIRIPDPAGYVPPRVWRSMTDAERRTCWTVQPDDVVVKGFAETDIFDGDGHRLEDLPAFYDEVCTIRFAHDNTGTNVPHIYAGGV